MNQPLFTTDKSIILASASPRRQSFLRQLGLRFSTEPATLDETPIPGETADVFVRRMATGKADAVSMLHPGATVIGADTVIAFRGEILGKPTTPADALATLKKLQGNSHIVMTAVSLCCRKDNLSATITGETTVTFGRFPETILAAYVRSGEPMDKAGAYAIQGLGGFLIQQINGSCSNVIGMPMHTLVTLLLNHGIISPS